MGPIHGRVLLASSAAALAGPSILLSLRSKSETAAIHDLVSKVDPARFQQVFNTGVDDAQALIDVSYLARFHETVYCNGCTRTACLSVKLGVGPLLPNILFAHLGVVGSRASRFFVSSRR